ncbi:hypothetical protein Cgig2_031156 [Carnegiea gigantea]|uniref:Nuclease associated modular domain-containing protein n=1 Tax=Carnegiea gigantea TaxID=171969 RepID=A0A9Q1KRG8_9CARY|nr:hypothetical protein Cgig2_031156 [Carnegiea gigantea]
MEMSIVPGKKLELHVLRLRFRGQSSSMATLSLKDLLLILFIMMVMTDIAIAQPSFQNHWGYTRLQLCVNGKATNCSLLQYEERWASFSIFFQNPGKIKIHLGHHRKLHPKFLVKAVATFDPKISVQSEDGGKESNVSLSIDESVSSTVHAESSDADSEEIDTREKLREKLRCIKISKVHKGTWNKGRKHSPETLQRIRERTKLALQDPKVRMKLGAKSRRQLSQEARDNISAGLRMVWKRRYQRLETQATCLFDWQNLIAEAAREGFDEEEELQWDSFEILEKQLQQEWLEMPRPKTANRAPITLEERRKISEAMAAKWADPEYRARVSSGLVKYYGTPEGTERRMKMKLSRLGQFRRNFSWSSSCSQEARDKISAGLRKAWKRRRQRLETQATCLFDWQNLIAEAAREGFDEEELWDSYEILEKQLPQEWLESMENGKATPRPKTGNRAPRTLEERRKFSEAIDGGHSKRTPRIKVGDAEGSAVNELEARSQQAKLKKEYVPKFKDPLASSKLEMLKSIRAQRVASQTKMNETLEQAKLLMAEARKAAKALEFVAMKSPVAKASLVQVRKLIAEVTQTIEKIENGKVGSPRDAASGYRQNQVERSGNGALTKDPSDEHPIAINGIAYLESSQGHNADFNLYRQTMLSNTYMIYHRQMRLGGYKFRELKNVDPATTQFSPHETEVCRDPDVRSLMPANRKIDSVNCEAGI